MTNCTIFAWGSLFYAFQSGFCKSFSTDWIKEIQLAWFCWTCKGVWLNHTILIKKLKAQGPNISALSWFTSYLSHRKQLVNISGVTYGFEKITCGVPQGSIIGPLFFLICVNDMEMSVDCKSVTVRGLFSFNGFWKGSCAYRKPAEPITAVSQRMVDR